MHTSIHTHTLSLSYILTDPVKSYPTTTANPRNWLLSNYENLICEAAACSAFVNFQSWSINSVTLCNPGHPQIKNHKSDKCSTDLIKENFVM